jgi:hypothetical protein
MGSERHKGEDKNEAKGVEKALRVVRPAVVFGENGLTAGKKGEQQDERR